MATKLDLKSVPNLVLNPVIHSFLEFLPLSRTEFTERIQNEVESNPMLEIESPEQQQQESESDRNDLQNKLEKADSSFVNRYEEGGFLRPGSDRIDKNRAIELFTASRVTLADHLIHQARSVFSPKELEVAKHIIYNLNRYGYLDLAIESIASAIQTTPEELERLRNIIKTFDPPGIASKTLRECLLAQIDDTEKEKLKLLIENHLEDLSAKKYTDIMAALEINHTELNLLIEELKRLNPNPGARFESEDIEYADVDLLLIKEGDEYHVKYIDEGIPQLLLSQYYDRMLNRTRDRSTKSFLKEKVRSAQLFIEGIELRRSMIVKIAQYLVDTQKDFLDFGEKWKKPLTMKEVGGALNFNESTISRAVNNKYLASEKGLISLKEFFSHGIQGEFGFKHSVATVKDKVKQIIEAEPPEKPLSDQEIAIKMKELGIRISRRTIRNYRDEMNIPNSSKRKEEYRLKGAIQ